MACSWLINKPGLVVPRGFLDYVLTLRLAFNPPIFWVANQLLSGMMLDIGSCFFFPRMPAGSIYLAAPQPLGSDSHRNLFTPYLLGDVSDTIHAMRTYISGVWVYMLVNIPYIDDLCR